MGWEARLSWWLIAHWSYRSQYRSVLEPSRRDICLIFGSDDGPTCFHDALYDLMAQENQLASLYYIGTSRGNLSHPYISAQPVELDVIQWPTEAQKGFMNGHQICVHTSVSTSDVKWNTDFAFSWSHKCLLIQNWRLEMVDCLGHRYDNSN